MKLSAFRKIAPALNEDLRAAFEKHGLKVAKTGATIDERMGVVNMRIAAADANLKDANGDSTTPEALRFKQMAALYDLSPSDLGRKFAMGGKEYVVAGLKNGRGTKPILVTRDGKTYVMAADVLKRFLVS